MEDDDEDFAHHILVQTLQQRQKRNRQYSLRAFARDIEISPATLSEFLSHKRAFSSKNAQKVVNGLSLSGRDRERFLLDAQGRASAEADNDLFELMSHWFYLATLNLAKVPINEARPSWIADRLGITEKQAEEAMLLLVELGFVTIEDGRFVVLKKARSRSTKIPLTVVRKHHQGFLSQAGLSFMRHPPHLREMRSVAIPVNPNIIPKARELLLDCKDKIASMLRDPSESWYILSYQLFPLDAPQATKPRTIAHRP